LILRKGIESDLKDVLNIEVMAYKNPYWNQNMLFEVLANKTDKRLWIYEVDNDVVERAQNGIVRQLESSGEVEIQSDLIGELVMNALGQIDHVAYIRYASVYRNFREASDFGKFVKDQIEDN